MRASPRPAHAPNLVDDLLLVWDAILSPLRFSLPYIWPAMVRHCTRLLYALALVPLVGLAACGAQGTPTQQAATLVTQGLQAQLSGDLATAEADYKKAIQLDQSNKFAHYDLGTVYDQQRNKTAALQEYQTTLIIDPNFANALFNTAVDTATSDPSSAELLYRRVLALQPNNADAWLNVGFVVLSEGSVAGARADWAKATSLNPSLASRLPNPLPTVPPTATPKPSPTPKP
jgi:Tfp pilus assembly protein PilF